MSSASWAPCPRTATGSCQVTTFEIEIRRANGARARVVGTIDRVPVAAGGEALSLVVINAVVAALPAKA